MGRDNTDLERVKTALWSWNKVSRSYKWSWFLRSLYHTHSGFPEQ